jgi:hypothetical protein
MTTFTFNAQLVATFMEKVAFVNAKLLRYNLPTITVLQLDSVKHITELGKVEKWAKVVLDAPKTVKAGADIEYLGTILFVDGIKQIFTVETADVTLGDIPDASLTCDHCKVNRKRIKYFMFRENGKIVSIGSSCAKDYFGWDIERYLDMFTYLADAAKELTEESMSSGFHSHSIFLNDVILATYMATSKWKSEWVSKAKADLSDKPSTGKVITHILFPFEDRGLVEEKRAVKASLPATFYEEVQAKLVATYGNTIPSNDFEHNIINNCFDGDGTLREFVVSAGIVGYAIYSVMHEKQAGSARVSNFVGTVGDRISAFVKVLDIKAIESAYGTSLLLVMEDSDGNLLKTFSTSQFAYNLVVGNTCTITGTIKCHETYRDIKSTVLTRVKG